MKIFCLNVESNKIKVCVYNSLKDFTQRIEWQDTLDENLKIIDKKGNIYEWDKNKIKETAIIYNYTLITKQTDEELGSLCQRNYALNNFANEFTFD